jgi:hypothetical protein
LNQATKVLAYSVPRCDSALIIARGNSRYFWLFDAPAGYHQISGKSSREKLVFQGPYARKYAPNVMPFGPVNGPAIFIVMIHDLKATWDALAQSRGIEVGEDTNCEIIIDDINGHSSSFDTALDYMECQLIVALSERLSLNLRKSSFSAHDLNLMVMIFAQIWSFDTLDYVAVRFCLVSTPTSNPTGQVTPTRTAHKFESNPNNTAINSSNQSRSLFSFLNFNDEHSNERQLGQRKLH